MEGIHGVDVGWLHHKHRDHGKSKDAPPAPRPRPRSSSPPLSHARTASDPQHRSSKSKNLKSSVSSPTLKPPPDTSKAAPAVPSTQKPVPSAPQPARDSSNTQDSTTGKSPPSKKRGWMSSLSSKFSSQSSSKDSKESKEAIQGVPPDSKSSSSTDNVKDALVVASDANTSATRPRGQSIESVPEPSQETPSAPQPARPGSSFLSGLRRLSSANGGLSLKGAGEGTLTPRKTLNVDHQRDRCPVHELRPARLKRVSFIVDVEIAGNSRYANETDADEETKATDKKAFERSEGETLRHSLDEEPRRGSQEDVMMSSDWLSDQTFDSTLSDVHVNAKAKRAAEKAARDKKKQERSERKISEAQALESVPVVSGAVTSESLQPRPEPEHDGSPVVKTQDRPTTDPLRIYRRCCQLREAPVLKRISEQLGRPENIEQPGIVTMLDLRRSRMQLADVVCLGDWLAVVPVKQILLEDANLTDEGIRLVLAGLLAAKPPNPHKRRKRGRSSPTRLRQALPRCLPGAVEKLTLKNNPKITSEGWRHICVFIAMCRSLKKLELSMLPFPQTQPSNGDSAGQVPDLEISQLLFKSLTKRLGGDGLEELILAECGLTTEQVGIIVEAAITCRIKRLSLASNQLDRKGMEHAARYISSGVSDGIDLGGNDLRNDLDILATALQGDIASIWALGLANCNLDVPGLKTLFPLLLKMPDLRFLDFSHNHDLFGVEPGALGLFRRNLPQLRHLKRLHLLDMSMTPAQAIGLAEVLPETRNLAHINILNNPQIAALAQVSAGADEEEACALYASFMTAVRLSKTMICVDIDVPVKESNEVVKALGKQIVAYCLRNLDLLAEGDTIKAADAASALPDIPASEKAVVMPESLQHLMGHPEDDSDHHRDGPDENYITGAGGIVKALSYFLNASDARRQSTAQRVNGTAPPTPTRATESGADPARAKDMTKTLLDSARKIRNRLQNARAQTSGGDEMLLRRLQFLDQTLHGMIARFEEEYPECRSGDKQPEFSDSFIAAEEAVDTSTSPARSRASSTISSTGMPASTGTWPPPSLEMREKTAMASALMPSSRRGSETSLHSRALANEEAQMHLLGQRFRRDVLPPKGTTDHLHGTSINDPVEPEHLLAFRRKLEETESEEIRDKVLHLGLDQTLRELGQDMQAMQDLELRDPAEFRRIRAAQVKAVRDGGGLA